MLLNGRVVCDVEVAGVCSNDYPDFSDAYFNHAVFEDTREELTDEELDQLAEENPDVVNEMAYDSYL